MLGSRNGSSRRKLNRLLTAGSIIAAFAVGYNYGRLHCIHSEGSKTGSEGRGNEAILLRPSANSALSELSRLKADLEAANTQITLLKENIQNIAESNSDLTSQLDALKLLPQRGNEETQEEKVDDTPDLVYTSGAEAEQMLISKVPGTSWKSLVAVDARRLAETVLKGYPAQRMKSVKGVLFSRHGGWANQCKELSLVVVSEKNRGQCVVVVEQQFDQYEVRKFARTENTEHNGGSFSTLNWTAQITAGFMPKERQQKESLRKLTTFLNHRDDMLKKLEPMVKKAGQSSAYGNTVTVMCLNAGMLDLALNFVCSCRNHKIDISSLIVFASDKVTHDTLIMLGVQAFWHNGFGNLPIDAANGYGDATFVAMMWLKVRPYFWPAVQCE
jgi:hypothetical protein